VAVLSHQFLNNMKKVIICILIILVMSCGEDQLNPSTVIFIQIEDNKTSILADNSSTLTVEALIDVKADKDKREITFTTTGGSFSSNGTQELKVIANDTLLRDGNQYLGAKATLKSGYTTSESVVVTADIEHYKARTSPIRFTPSEPVSIKLSSNVFGIANTYDSEAILTAKISSATGVPSKGESVQFHVLDAATNSEFSTTLFREEHLSFNSEGIASAIFSAGNLTTGSTPFIGNLLVIAKVANRENLTDTLTLNVSPKPK